MAHCDWSKPYLKPVFFLLLLAGCQTPNGNNQQGEKMQEKDVPSINWDSIDIQGHRGCRGLMPENTIAAFEKALDLGVKTLEMDVVITADNRVLCSHEPWFSHEIALDTNGNEIPEKEEKDHAIYSMDYGKTQKYDVGLKPHPRFPEQTKMAAKKPLLTAVIDAAESHAKEAGRSLPYYNIETKCLPEGDGIFHPKPAEFSELLVGVIKQKGIAERSAIQSFDIRTLQYIRSIYPEISLALLIENSESAEANIETLGFIPEIYSPDFALVNEALLQYCEENNIKLIPWTINETSELKKAAEMGVDGIITDYPDRVLALQGNK